MASYSHFDVFCSVSDSLSPCHECWKVRHGFGNSDNICQFQGFRKIRKVEASAKLGILPFEACGFLDPYSDPTEEDKRIWQVNDFQIHPEMTPEVAKYVFKHASGLVTNSILFC